MAFGLFGLADSSTVLVCCLSANAMTQNTQCPVCGSCQRLTRRTPECIVSRCVKCSHEYTIESEIFVPEVYKSDYYDITHKRWFDNPQYSLFRKILNGLLEVNPKLKDQDSSLRILDVGCGRCALLQYFANFLPEAEFVGLDTSVGSVRPTNPRIALVDSVFKPSAVPGDFDVVISTAVIEHIADARGFLLDQLSLLKNTDSSVLVVVTMDSNSPVYVLARLLRRLGFSLAYNRLYSPHHVNHFSRESLLSLCHSLNLVQIKSDGINMELSALDLPDSRIFPRRMLEIITALIFSFGAFIRRPFLQIHYFRALA